MHGLSRIETDNAKKRKKADGALEIVPCEVKKCVYFFEVGERPFSALYRDEWMRCQHCTHHAPQDLSFFY